MTFIIIICGDHLLIRHEAAKAASPAAAAPFVDLPTAQATPPAAIVATEEMRILETKDGLSGFYGIIFFGSIIKGSFSLFDSTSILGFYTGYASSTFSTFSTFSVSVACFFSLILVSQTVLYNFPTLIKRFLSPSLICYPRACFLFNLNDSLC